MARRVVFSSRVLIVLSEPTTGRPVA